MKTKATTVSTARIFFVTLLTLLSPGYAAGQDGGSVKDLINQLRAKDPKARERAAFSLGKKDGAAVPDLSAALSDGDPEVRRGAAYALGEIGPDAREAAPELADLLKDEDKSVRRAAAYALGRIGLYAGGVVSALLGALEDESPDVRVYSAQSLGEIRADPERVVPQLLLKLRDPDASVRITSVRAIQRYGPEAANSLPRMLDMLADGDDSVRAAAAMMIGGVGPAAAVAIPNLVELLSKDEDPHVRLSAAQALGGIGPEAKRALPDLRRALRDRNHSVRGQAAVALGKIREGVGEAIPDLITLLRDPDLDVRESSARSLGQIAIGLSRAQNVGALDQLREANAALRGVKEPNVVAYEAEVSQAVDGLEAIRSKQTLRRKAWAYVLANPWTAMFLVLLITYLLLPLCYLIIYWCRPMWMLQLSEAVERLAVIKVEVRGVTLSAAHLALVFPFRYRRRVLDAWVKRNAVDARSAFKRRVTVGERQVYAPIPVTLDNDAIQDVAAEHLRSLFSRNRAYLLILGEGGAGKTSLACRFGGWALEEAPGRRLCETHLMLPVLIEEDLPSQAGPGVNSFLTEVGNQLRGLVDAKSLLSAGLLKELLRQGRVLVIIDGLSEKKEETQRALAEGVNFVPANATIVTSRSGGLPGNSTGSTLTPMRIDSEHLTVFVAVYLSALGKAGLFNDPEIQEGLARLSDLAGRRKVTALLAKMYVELMIARKEKDGREDMPRNIPELMISYVRTIYEKSVPYQEGMTEVLNAAQIIAWNCVRRSYRPTQIKEADALKVLASMGRGAAPQLLLEYLEGQLKLIQRTGHDRSRFRFTLDPLAEYLAGWYAVGRYREDETRWMEFINQVNAPEAGAESARDFRLALFESALARADEVRVPAAVMEELRKLTLEAQPTAAV